MVGGRRRMMGDVGGRRRSRVEDGGRRVEGGWTGEEVVWIRMVEGREKRDV